MAKAQQSAKAAAKKRIVRVDAAGDVHINATFNNLIISITNTNSGNEVVMIKDITPLPHNGCRPPKKRRV